MRVLWFVIAGAVIAAGLGLGWWLYEAATEAPAVQEVPAVQEAPAAQEPQATPAAPGGPAAPGKAPGGEDALLLAKNLRLADRNRQAFKAMNRHWFEGLTAERVGMTPEAFADAKASSGKLGMPVGGADAMTVEAFDYVKIPSGDPEASSEERLVSLLLEAAAQGLPTLAPPLAWLGPEGLQKEGTNDKQNEYLLPVPPGTNVSAPLTKGSQPKTNVLCGGNVRHDEDGAPVLQAMVKKVRTAGHAPGGAFVRFADVDDWFQVLKQPGTMTYQICIAFQ